MNIAQIQVQVPATVQITVDTAWDTLQIIDRQSRKDIGKVIDFAYSTYLVLTSPEAKQTYRMIREAVVILSMIAYASWLTLQEWCDAFVTGCETASEDVAMPDVDPVADEPAEEHLLPVKNGSDMQDFETSAIVLPTPALPTPSKPIFELTRAELLAMAQELKIAGYRKMSNTRLQRKLQQLVTA